MADRVDVGGRFTHVIIFNEDTPGLPVNKDLSTRENPSKGVVK
jgi:N-methylhydantoinase A/oxoprolinase/acetone carboxylase beta subunit